jgi:DNA-binding NarL/FixJ family response regulator
MPPLRVAVRAADPAARAELERLLAAQEGLRVVPDSGRRPVSEPDVLVVAEGRGLTAGDTEAGSWGAPAVVCISEDPGAVGRLVAAGLRAWALLGPSADGPRLAEAARAVHRGLVVLQPPLAPGWFPARPPGGGPRLTPREREVLSLLAQGLGNKQIAWELEVSEHTVKYHVSSLYAKLGASSRTEALRLGIERGLLSL